MSVFIFRLFFVVCVNCRLLSSLLSSWIVFFFLMIRRPPRSTRTDTLSLHDALPISLLAYMAVIPLQASKSVYTTAPTNALKRKEERSEEHTSELQSLMRISYAVFCLKKKTHTSHPNTLRHT